MFRVPIIGGAPLTRGGVHWMRAWSVIGGFLKLDGLQFIFEQTSLVAIGM